MLVLDGVAVGIVDVAAVPDGWTVDVFVTVAVGVGVWDDEQNI